MGKYEKLAREIVKNVGGKQNISGLSHCVTRLRFVLKDEKIANDDVLKNMDGVVTVMKSGGQYQVVIGNHVPMVYADVCEIAGINGGNELGEPEKKMSFTDKVIDLISGCFQSVLAVMCAAGMVKGFNALFVFLKLYPNTSGTYLVFNAIGDSIFYFLPILIGYASAKTFKLNPMLGMLIGCILCYPTVQASAIGGDAIGTFFGIEYKTTFLGMPLIANNYTTTVIPVIFVNAVASKVQKICNKFVPEVIKTFFVPFLTLIVSLSLAFLIIGPVTSVLTNVLTSGFMMVNDFSPLLMGALVGFLWQVLVIFGLHWALVPLFLMCLTTMGYNPIQGSYGVGFAQTGVVAAMYFKLKDEKIKKICPAAVISGLCGVTEPSIYGISLPKKLPFVFSMVGGAIGGAIMGGLGAKGYTSGGMGIFGVVNYINPENSDPAGMYIAILTIVVSLAAGFILTYLFWNDKEPVNDETKSSESRKVAEGEMLKKEDICSPVKGKVKLLEAIADDAFAQGALGKGCAIEPSEGKVYAPFDGEVTSLFPTKHAIGLLSESGCEMLIHIGLDTVQLQGKFFEKHVEQGDKIKKGQLLISFDKEQIEKEGYCLDTPVIITNTDDYLDIVEIGEGEVAQGDLILKALR